jgi:uncharacterized membrane protein
VHLDDAHRVRVIVEPRTFPELLQSAIEPVAIYSERNPAIAERLLAALRMLADVVRRPEDRAAVRRLAEFTASTTLPQLTQREHRARIEQRRDEVIAAVSRPAPRRRAVATVDG